MTRGNRILAVMGVLVLMVSAQAQANVRFYRNLLEQGKAAFQGGQYETAARDLQIAAFGFLESLPEYETAEIYLALANHRLGRDAEARNAIESVMRAEQVTPTYRTLAIDPRIRSAFEAAIATLMPPSQSLRSAAPSSAARQQPVNIPSSTGDRDAQVTVPMPAPASSTEANGAGQAGNTGSSTPPSSTEAAAPTSGETSPTTPATSDSGSPQASPRPQPTPTPRIISTPEIRDLEAILAKEPDSTSVQLALADAHLRAGNVDAASKLATKVLGIEPKNAIANTYLARIAKRRGDMSDAISHYRAAQAAGPLSDDDQAALFVCYVTAGDYASARTLEPSLTEKVRQEPDVAKAIDRLHGAPESAPEAGSPRAEASPPGTSGTSVGSASRQPDRSPPPAPDTDLVTESRTPNPPDKEDIFVSIREARRYAEKGDCASATRIYVHVLAQSNLHRYVLLAIGRGLGACQAWSDSLEAYTRAEPLRDGEEEHMFRVAVDQYHLGNLAAAREYLDRALPNLEMTDEVQRYVDLIRGTR